MILKEDVPAPTCSPERSAKWSLDRIDELTSNLLDLTSMKAREKTRLMRMDTAERTAETRRKILKANLNR